MRYRNLAESESESASDTFESDEEELRRATVRTAWAHRPELDAAGQEANDRAGYLQPTISFLSKGRSEQKETEAKPTHGQDSDAAEYRSQPSARSEPSQSRSQSESHSQPLRRAVKNLKERESQRGSRGARRREKEKSFTNQDRSEAQTHQEQQLLLPKERSSNKQRGPRKARLHSANKQAEISSRETRKKNKKVRFPVEGCGNRVEEIESKGKQPSTRDGGRLWQDVPESSDELYSSLAADIKAVFDRAMSTETGGAAGESTTASASPRAGSYGSSAFLHISNISSKMAQPNGELSALAEDRRGEETDLDGTRKAYQKQQEALHQKSLLLQKELQRVEESRMQLELTASQKALQNQAKHRLETYETKLSRNLEHKIRSFMEDKESKLREIREFRSVIDSKLLMLKQVLKQLQTKEEHLETAYCAAIQEIHSEHSASLAAKAKELEAEVNTKLRLLVKSMATKRKGVR